MQRTGPALHCDWICTGWIRLERAGEPCANGAVDSTETRGVRSRLDSQKERVDRITRELLRKAKEAV
jgi:hypothetical protein